MAFVENLQGLSPGEGAGPGEWRLRQPRPGMIRVCRLGYRRVALKVVTFGCLRGTYGGVACDPQGLRILFPRGVQW